ncbi:hypothetical protein JOC37_002213 [Desulfohalotomaculum tongense]|nr:hypothetical protein [Desulforadius tongensis]MBM7855798.1 hypothetical protein [Desulforadius tongensis]
MEHVVYNTHLASNLFVGLVVIVLLIFILAALLQWLWNITIP